MILDIFFREFFSFSLQKGHMSSQFLTFLPRLRTGRHPIDLTVLVVFVGFVIATSKDKTSEQPGHFLITSKSAWFRNEQYEYLIYQICFIYDIIYCKSIYLQSYLYYIYTRIHLNITWTSMHTSPHPFGPLKYQKPNAERPKDQKLPASFASSERFDAFSPGTGCGRHHSWAWLVNTSYITIAICLNHFIHHRIDSNLLKKRETW